MSAQTEGSYNIAISVVDGVARTGSGDVIIGGGFTPIPRFPFNNCNLPRSRSSNFVGRRAEIQKVMDALASEDWIVMIDCIIIRVNKHISETHCFSLEEKGKRYA